MADAPGDVTVLLSRLKDGDRSAAEALYPLIYDDLKRIATRLFARQRPSHTLGPTALVHEAYLKLAGAGHEAAWKDSAHALAVAARAMRQVLANHARDRGAGKRGGGEARGRVTLAGVIADAGDQAVDAAALHEAFARLEALDERQARIAELKLLGGLTTQQVATLLGIAPRTVELDWRMAKQVLAAVLQDVPPPGAGATGRDGSGEPMAGG